MSNKKESKKAADQKKVVPVPFKQASKFGGAANTFVTKSQYKPEPVRITQHKG